MQNNQPNVLPFPSTQFGLKIDLSYFASALYSNDDIQKILSYFRNRNHTHYMILKFLLSTGLSVPDLVQFRIIQFDNDRQLIKIPARKRLFAREIHIGEEFSREIYRFCIQKDIKSPLFPGHKGNREGRSIQKILEQASRQLGKKINIPLIRDSLALYFNDRGIPKKEIQSFLGHRYLKSTRHRILEQEKRLMNTVQGYFDDKKNKAA